MTFDPGAAAAPDAGIFGLTTPLKESGVVVVPVPFEATTSYGGGTAHGPGAILEASKQVDLFDYGTGKPYEAGIFMLEIVYATVSAMLAQGKLVATLGGDHAAPFGAIQAHAEKYPGCGILHVDAHADLRPAYEGFVWSHASIFYNVVSRLAGVERLVQVGIRDFSEEEMRFAAATNGRVIVHHDEQLVHRKFDGVPWTRIVKGIIADLPKKVYVSFDIDGLDPALCPHTGTPVPGGLSFHEAVALLAGIVSSGREIIGVDLCEVTPGPDGDEWDANVGARLLYKLIGYALLSRSRAKPT